MVSEAGCEWEVRSEKEGKERFCSYCGGDIMDAFIGKKYINNIAY